METTGRYTSRNGLSIVWDSSSFEFADGINYPYFFLNWGSPAGAFGFTNELPYMGSVWWIALLLLFLIIVGYTYSFEPSQ